MFCRSAIVSKSAGDCSVPNAPNGSLCSIGFVIQAGFSVTNGMNGLREITIPFHGIHAQVEVRIKDHCGHSFFKIRKAKIYILALFVQKIILIKS